MTARATGGFDPAAFLPVIEARLLDLPQGLQDHVARARAIGTDLSEIHGTDAGAVDLAIAAHDLFRALGGEDLLAEAARRGWEPDPVERASPMLIHGQVAGLWLMQEAGVGESAIIDAVTWHTTYAPNMGPVATVTFLADKIDPWKVDRDPWLEDVRDLAYGGRAEDAVELYLCRLLARLIEDGGIAHPRALEALNYLRLGRQGLL